MCGPLLPSAQQVPGCQNRARLLPRVPWSGSRPHWRTMLVPFSISTGTPASAWHLKDLTLFGSGPEQAPHHQPAALVVLDVGANLARHTGVPKQVEVVILGRGAEKGAGEAAGRGRGWAGAAAFLPESGRTRPSPAGSSWRWRAPSRHQCPPVVTVRKLDTSLVFPGSRQVHPQISLQTPQPP